jgi:hypothetical protein
MKKGALLVAAVAAAAAALAGVQAAGGFRSASAASATTCALGAHGSRVKHVIYLVFDNTHFRRDAPSVPSDLEQMPHLLNFLKGNGTLLTNFHTILISHTAGGILTSMTGLYPDRNGQTVSNSYDYYRANGTPTFTSSFKYWTDTVDGTDDSLPNMVFDGGQTVPAPWLTFTHAGCDVGGVSAANIELENNSTAAAGDMTRVFGTGSPEWNEANDPTTRTKSLADFVGIAIHCSLGSSLCNTPNAKPDDETTVPGSNNGYKALFGAKYVNPAITGGQPCVKATDGTDITDAAGNCGFPGFDGALAKNTLGMVAQMQEHGVPVTYAYISDAHDNHTLARASGPGEADYKQQLADYDAAFATFFDRLAHDGITKDNTLFVVTADEGDHYAGNLGTPQPDGSLAYSHTPCLTLTACPANQIGEITANLKGLLPAGEPTFDLHFDSSPTIYVNGQPTRLDPTVRKLGQDLATATATDPYKGGATVPIAERLADTVGMQALHMINNDPKRTPTLVMFGNPDFFFQASNPTCGTATAQVACVDPKFAWNHGDIQEEIANNFLGLVGPGVRRLGVNGTVWGDHVDTRPTMLALAGLRDSYELDGRVITQVVDGRGDDGGRNLEQLGNVYKQLNAPFGAFGLATLTASTKALSSPDDLAYEAIESRIANLTFQRDNLAAAIRSALNDASFGDRHGGPNGDQVHDWIAKAQQLIDDAKALAAS